MKYDIVAVAKKESEITKKVTTKVQLTHIDLPKNYSVSNAIQSALMRIREVVDSSKRPAIEVCSRDSIEKAIFSMIIQGLSPVKEQCHFIVRGSKLTMMRGYLGSIAVAKRVENWLKDVYAVAIFEEDDFSYEVRDGRKHVLPHKQSLKSTLTGNIIGAYAIAIDHDNKPVYTEVMNINEIYRAWSKSTTHVFLDNGALNPKSVHFQFPERMARRTVINRLCKAIISTSSDELLLYEALTTDADITIEEEIDLNANKELLDFDQQPEQIEQKEDGKVIDIAFPPAPAQEPEPEPEPIEMASKDDCKRIYDLNVSAGRNGKEEVLGQVGDFFSREISGLSDLTKDEAIQYIEAMENQTKNDPVPDWM